MRRLVLTGLCLIALSGGTRAAPVPGDAVEGAPPLPDGAGVVQQARTAWTGGRPRDAVALLFPAALDGVAAAQTELGYLYVKGIGVGQNLCVATLWFDKAARAGDATAQNNMGAAYMGGFGVRRDDVLAYLWFTAAMRSGYATAEADRYALTGAMSDAELARARLLAKNWDPATAAPADLVIPTETLHGLEPASDALLRAGLQPCKWDR